MAQPESKLLGRSGKQTVPLLDFTPKRLDLKIRPLPGFKGRLEHLYRLLSQNEGLLSTIVDSNQNWLTEKTERAFCWVSWVSGSLEQQTPIRTTKFKTSNRLNEPEEDQTLIREFTSRVQTV